MQVELRSHGVCIPTEDEVAQLVERLEAMDAWAKAQQRLCVPSEKRVVLVPPVAKSVVCGGTTLCPHSSTYSLHPFGYTIAYTFIFFGA